MAKSHVFHAQSNERHATGITHARSTCTEEPKEHTHEVSRPKPTAVR